MPTILYEDVQDNQVAEKIIKVQGLLEGRRKSFEPLKQLAIDLALPRRGDLSDYDKESSRGSKKGQQIYDDTAILAVKTCVNGLQGQHISPSFNWFKSSYTPRELRENKEVIEWLQLNDEIIYDILNRSDTFYPQSGEWMSDGITTGDGSFYIEPDYNKGTVEIIVPNLWQMYHMRDTFGNTIVAHRKFKMTAIEAAHFFSKESQGNLSLGLRNNIKENPFTEYEFLHCTYKNSENRDDKLFFNYKPYIGFYVQIDGKHEIERGGYNTVNPITWSVFRSSGEDCGRGIVGDAIISIATGNQYSRILLKAGQLGVEPAYRVSKELRGRVDLRPRAENYIDTVNQIIEPIITNIQYPVAKEERDRIVEAIKEHFMLKFFEGFTSSDKEFRVLEILERKSEKAVLMGRFINDLNRITDKALDRVFDIGMEAGWLEPAPAIIEDYIAKSSDMSTKMINIDYTGPMNQIQKQLLSTQPIIQGLESSRQIFEIKEDAIDKVDLDGILEDILRSFAFPEKRIRSDEIVEQIRTARAQRKEAMENVEQIQKLIKAVPSLQKASEEGSPLASLAGAK